MITPEQHAEIRRLFYGEHWKVGTIAAALGVHHDTVRAAIVHDTHGVRRGTCRTTQLDPYLPFVRDTLAQYPRLRATRLFEMVKSRGYTGSVVQLRRAVRLIRPAATATVYRRLVTLAGEEAQVDWGAFGSIRIGRGVRPLSGFVMVLAYSRAFFALFTVDQTLESFLRGHIEAFAAYQGVARTLVYDTSAAPCSTAPGPRFGFIRDSWSSPGIITLPRGRVRPAARTRKGRSSGRSRISDTPSSPPARLPTSTISTRSFGAGGMRSRISARIPSSAIAPSRTCSPRSSRACCRYRPIPSTPM
jgi:hypothetical protein